jgi:hypothetical protein
MRSSFLLAFSFLLSIQLAGQDCFYQLRLEDSGGDGFTGGVVTVTVAGVPTTYTLNATNDDGRRRDFFFPVTNGDLITVGYVAGAFPGEVSLSVLNNNDSLLFASTAPATAPVLTTLTASCVSCAPPPLSSIELFRVRFNSVDIRFRSLPASVNPTYRIEYGPGDFDPAVDEGTTVTSQDTMLRITGLASDSTYSFYISTLCDPAAATTIRRGPFRIRTQRQNDVGITALRRPVDGCVTDRQDSVIVGITNFGGAAQQFFRVDFTVNGQPGGVNFPFDGIYTGVVGVDSTEFFAFDVQADLREPGFYTFEIETQLAEDENSSNDAFTTTVVRRPVISQLPYTENFEGGEGFWLPEQLGRGPSSWARGRPRGSRIDRAASGSFAYVTNPRGSYNDRERSVLRSPCFDFSGMADDPVLSFSLFVDTEPEFDRLYLESSTDGGRNWRTVERNATGINWYNNGVAQAWDGDGGFGGGYARVSQQLRGLAGEGDVQLRFVFESDGDTRREGIAIDDIRITEQAEIDIAAVELEFPVTGGCFGLDTILFTYVDVGRQRVDSLTINYAGGPVRVAAPTVRGQQRTVALPVDIAGPPPGPLTVAEFVVSIEVAGDGQPDNDTIRGLFDIIRESPFLVDFEDGRLPSGYRVGPGTTIGQRSGQSSVTLYRNLSSGDDGLTVITPFYGPLTDGDTLTFRAGIDPVAAGGEASARLTVLFEEGCADRIDTLFQTELGDLREYQIPLSAVTADTGIFTFVVEYLAGDFFVDLDDIAVRGGCPANLDVRISTSPPAGIFADDGEAFAQVFGGVGPYTFSWTNGDSGASADSLSVETYSVTVTDALGCQETKTFDVGLQPTSLTDPEGILSDLRLFPNPTGGRVTLQVDLPHVVTVAWELYDLRGRRRAGAMPASQRNWTEDIDLSELPAGMYLLRVRAGDALRTLRVIRN